MDIISNTPAHLLGFLAPITVYPGLEAAEPLNLALPSIGYLDIDSVDTARVLQKLKINQLLKTLDYMHRKVNYVSSANRKAAREHHKAKTGANSYNLIVADYVVVARTKRPRAEVFVNWVGPRRVAQLYRIVFFALSIFWVKRLKTSKCYGMSPK